jgi:hypothetical protein
VDYVDWVDRVRQAIVSAWDAGDEYVKEMGADMQVVLNSLGLSVDSRAPDFETSSLYSAITDAIQDLEDEGWVEVVTFWQYRATDKGRKLPADASAIWHEIISAASLTDEQQASLEALNEIAVEEAAEFACLQKVSGEDVANKLGWESERVSRVTRELKELRLLRRSGFVGPEVHLTPTYRGIVTTSRRLQSEHGKLLRDIVENWEERNVEVVGELDLTREKHKGGFIQDILALATTLLDERRFYLIGLHPQTRELYESVDEGITQDRLDALLSVYIDPMPRIKYGRVRYEDGVVGMAEVYQDKRDLPYKVRKDVWKLKVGHMRVRHGSLSEPPTPEERDAIVRAGKRARGEPF